MPSVEVDYTLALCAVVVLLLCILISYTLVQRKLVVVLKWIPESILIMLVGVVIGLVTRLLFIYGYFDDPGAFLTYVEPEIFLVILLPPILFESGYSMKKRYFFRNLGSILLFAVVGTLISAFMIGFGVYVAGKSYFSTALPFLEAMAFGSLNAATDPVSTLAVLGRLRTDPNLYIVIFGESVLNDAVALVLYDSFARLIESSGASSVDAVPTLWIVLSALVRFIATIIFSTLIGGVVGLASSLFFKHLTGLQGHSSLTLCAFVCWAYLSYLVASALLLSGITAMLAVAVVMSHYTRRNLTEAGEHLVHDCFSAMAYLSETAIFLVLGAAVFAIQHTLYVAFTCWALFLVIFGRFVHVVVISSLIDVGGVISRGIRAVSRAKTMRALAIPSVRRIPLGIRQQILIAFAGLRGGVAFALALLFSASTTANKEDASAFVTTTLVVVYFTTLVMGVGTLPLVKLLRLNQEDSDGSGDGEVFLPSTLAGEENRPLIGSEMDGSNKSNRLDSSSSNSNSNSNSNSLDTSSGKADNEEVSNVVEPSGEVSSSILFPRPQGRVKEISAPVDASQPAITSPSRHASFNLSMFEAERLGVDVNFAPPTREARLSRFSSLIRRLDKDYLIPFFTIEKPDWARIREEERIQEAEQQAEEREELEQLILGRLAAGLLGSGTPFSRSPYKN
jgi:solute carrier family 9 (sodium/hydrogen exchanger), member 8